MPGEQRALAVTGLNLELTIPHIRRDSKETLVSIKHLSEIITVRAGDDHRSRAGKGWSVFVAIKYSQREGNDTREAQESNR